MGSVIEAERPKTAPRTGLPLATTAYNAGLRGNILRWRMSAFAFVLVALIVVIMDFDITLYGFIQVSEESLATLIPEMKAALADQ